MDRPIDLALNKGEVFDLGDNPEVHLIGVTLSTLILTGTGTLDLDIVNGVIDNVNALEIYGFDKVTISGGNLFGGIKLHNNKSYKLSSLTVQFGGIEFSGKDPIGLLDLEMVRVLDSKTTGILIEGPKVKDLLVSDCTVLNSNFNNLEISNVNRAKINNCIFTNMNKQRFNPSQTPTFRGVYQIRPYGKDKDVLIKSNCVVSMSNTLYETIYVQDTSKFYTI